MCKRVREPALTTASPVRAMTGFSLPHSGFCVREASGEIDAAQVLQVLTGELAGYRVRDFLPKKHCRRIVENFWASGHRTPRYGEGDEGVEGYLIGASHIGKTTDQYLCEAKQAETALRGLYGGAVDPIVAFRAALADQGAVRCIRAAVHDGHAAGGSKAVCWNNTGPFLLLPHEDVAQLSDPLQAGFEIQRLSRVMAVNVYPQVTEGAGQIQLWNIEPDHQTRARLGLDHTGYPYPQQLLEDFESLTTVVQTGDLCLINGNLIHAVRGGGPSTGMRKRLLITCFMGMTKEDELMWWT
jgi:hypothetical protein